jgi:hypothetical protein
VSAALAAARAALGAERAWLVGGAVRDRLIGREPGAGAVLIGDGITAEEVAARLGTINYEVTCGLTARVPRVIS